MILPLDGIRVIDLTQVFMGPAAAQMLGDFGAEVIKVERPGVGEISRAAVEDPLGELNPVFASLNRNKRGIVLDLRNPAAIEVLLQLLARADVLLSNFRPGVLDKMGLGSDRLSALNPRLIIASGSGFGADGPLALKPGQDFLAQATTGMLSRRLDPNQAATVPNTAIADYVTGQHLVQGILLALIARERTGLGQEVQVSLYASMIAAQMQEATVERMRGKELNWAATLLTGTYRTCEGEIMVVGSFSQYANTLPAFAQALGIEEFKRPEYAEIGDALEAEPELRELLATALGQLPTDEALAALESAGILCAPVRPLREALAHEQTTANELLVDIPTDAGEAIKTVGSPIRLSATPADVRTPPPRLGEHTRQVLEEAGYSTADIDRLAAVGAFGDTIGPTS